MPLDIDQLHQPRYGPGLLQSRWISSPDLYCQWAAAPLMAIMSMVFGSNLDFDGKAVRAVENGVQGLITVGFRQGDEVLESARFRLVKAVNCAQRQVTVSLGLGDDPKRVEVRHLGKRLRSLPSIFL